MGTMIVKCYRNVLLLDNFPTLNAVYSLRKLRSNYNSSVVRVRRSSDDSLTDFTPIQITDGTLIDWVGTGNNGFVQTWYDQSGNQNNAVAPDTASEPLIVEGGVLVTKNDRPALRFQDNLLNINAISGQSRYANAVASCTTADDNAPIIVGTIVGSQTFMGFGSFGTGVRYRILNPDAGASYQAANTLGQTRIMSYRKYSADTSTTTFVDNAQQHTIPSTSTLTDVLGIGGRHSSQTLTNGTIQEVIISSFLEDSYRNHLELNQMDYYL